MKEQNFSIEKIFIGPEKIKATLVLSMEREVSKDEHYQISKIFGKNS